MSAPSEGGRTRGLVTVGETMGLLSAVEYGPLRHARHVHLGVAGAESNVAIGVRRLGHPATWVGRLGADDMGDLVEATLRGEGVDLSVARDPERPTGLMVKSRRTSATTKVTYYRAGSAASVLGPADLPPDLVASASVLHVTGITAALSPSCMAAVESAVGHARRAGTIVSFDVNHRSALWSDAVARPALRRLVGQADIVFAGEDEASLVLGADAAAGAGAVELATALAELGPREVVVKRGAGGALAMVDGTRLEERGIPVTAVDPVGAGDAFVAGYLAEVLDGAGPAQRLRTANMTGAFAVTVSGDWEGAPTREELGLLGHPNGSVLR
jgi:2-dehydro-3-deoxygluconokinase